MPWTAPCRRASDDVQSHATGVACEEIRSDRINIRKRATYLKVEGQEDPREIGYNGLL